MRNKQPLYLSLILFACALHVFSSPKTTSPVFEDIASKLDDADQISMQIFKERKIDDFELYGRLEAKINYIDEELNKNKNALISPRYYLSIQEQIANLRTKLQTSMMHSRRYQKLAKSKNWTQASKTAESAFYHLKLFHKQIHHNRIDFCSVTGIKAKDLP